MWFLLVGKLQQLNVDLNDMNKIIKTTLLTILVLILLTSIVIVGVIFTIPFAIIMGILGFSILTISIWNIIYINLKD